MVKGVKRNRRRGQGPDHTLCGPRPGCVSGAGMGAVAGRQRQVCCPGRSITVAQPGGSPRMSTCFVHRRLCLASPERRCSARQQDVQVGRRSQDGTAPGRERCVGSPAEPGPGRPDSGSLRAMGSTPEVAGTVCHARLALGSGADACAVLPPAAQMMEQWAQQSRAVPAS